MSNENKGRIAKTDEDWRRELSPEEYAVTRCSATEPPFSHPYNFEKRDGIYHCRCCGEPLFTSEAKYESGSGWPSFFQPVSENAVVESIDLSHNMVRTEVTCANCGAHLGHVFPDGPRPTGLRYCMNGTALKLEPKEG
jgi:peptide-methionine (R)-S-oxide reductase